jgi:hypothetical protein
MKSIIVSAYSEIMSNLKNGEAQFHRFLVCEALFVMFLFQHFRIFPGQNGLSGCGGAGTQNIHDCLDISGVDGRVGSAVIPQ